MVLFPVFWVWCYGPFEEVWESPAPPKTVAPWTVYQITRLSILSHVKPHIPMTVTSSWSMPQIILRGSRRGEPCDGRALWGGTLNNWSYAKLLYMQATQLRNASRAGPPQGEEEEEEGGGGGAARRLMLRLCVPEHQATSDKRSVNYW